MPERMGLVLRSGPGAAVTTEMGIEVGRALAAEHKRVAVISDDMRSTRMMKEALISGILSQGADVLDCGSATEAAAAYAARLADCSAYVSECPTYGNASGYRLFGRDGRQFTESQIRRLDSIRDNLVTPNHMGLGKRIPYVNAVSDYNSFASSRIGKMSGAPVLLDCGCGIASESAPQVLESVGIEVISVNCHRSRDFVPKDPSAEAQQFGWLHDLISNKEGCIGIGMDRIGSRATVIGEDGNIIDHASASALAVRSAAPKSIVMSMNVTSRVKDEFLKNGGDPEMIYMAPMGTADVAAVMAEKNADMAVCDAGIMYSGIPALDGIRTAAAISKLANSGSLKKMAEDVSTLRDISSIKVDNNPGAFDRGMETALSGREGKIFVCKDGWRVDMDKGWVLIRKPKEGVCRVSAESPDSAYLAGLLETGADMVRIASKSQ